MIFAQLYELQKAIELCIVNGRIVWRELYLNKVFFFLKSPLGTSLVAQWLRIRL